LFTAPLDFGANAFDGTARWLETAVRKNEPPGPPPAFVTLSPRQPITVAPYALQAARANTAAGLVGTGSQPLEFFVNNIRAMRLEVTSSSPNVIGDSVATTRHPVSLERRLREEGEVHSA